MFLSVKSLSLFMVTNMYMAIFGLGECYVEQQIISYGSGYKLLLLQVLLCVKNYMLMSIIEWGLRHKENISDVILKEEYKGEFMYHLFQSTFIESLTLLFVQKYYFGYVGMEDLNFLNEFLWFFPLSFIFEIIFDFFHYWTHRMAHSNKTLYKFLHKKHHKFVHPTAIITYYQEPLDLIITNSIPNLLTLCLMPKLSYFQYILILLYKSHIEISGHVGKKLYPNGSFSQFIWLPKILGIELYTEDHDIHHSKNNCNYSKRFSLWDKVFGTFYKNI